MDETYNKRNRKYIETEKGASGNKLAPNSTRFVQMETTNDLYSRIKAKEKRERENCRWRKKSENKERSLIGNILNRIF